MKKHLSKTLYKLDEEYSLDDVCHYYPKSFHIYGEFEQFLYKYKEFLEIIKIREERYGSIHEEVFCSIFCWMMYAHLHYLTYPIDGCLSYLTDQIINENLFTFKIL